MIYIKYAHSLETILQRKRNKPKAVRALKANDYETLFTCHCPRMVRYKPSKRIARSIVKHVTKDLPRLQDRRLAWVLFKRMKKLPLNIGLERPRAVHFGNHKSKWYEMGIRDKLVLKALLKYLIDNKYTCRRGKNNWSKIRNYRTLFIHTYYV